MTTAAAPTDPLAFDYELGFDAAENRAKNERAERLANAERQMPYHVSFLDDCLRSILPNDLILLGAATGAGKTELARLIATANASYGKRVYFFALEAERNEIERRIKFSIIADLVEQNELQLRAPFNYRDWYRGEFEGQLATLSLNEEAEKIFAETFRGRFFTYYRGKHFDGANVKRHFLAIQDQADLIVLDHLHYVDVDDENENRGLKETIKTIRNAALDVGKPVILVAHLRKRDLRDKRLVPAIDEFHGSSDVAKICTHAIVLAPCYDEHVDAPKRKHVSRTFMAVLKDRALGAQRAIACVDFDMRNRKYAGTYTLGRDRNGKFEPYGLYDAPWWASQHKPFEGQQQGGWQ
jgi:hypothetical protein